MNMNIDISCCFYNNINSYVNIDMYTSFKKVCDAEGMRGAPSAVSFKGRVCLELSIILS